MKFVPTLVDKYLYLRICGLYYIALYLHGLLELRLGWNVDIENMK